MTTVAVVGHVPSWTKAGVSYAVTRQSGVLACDCPAFSYAKGPVRECKHTRIVVFAEAIEKTCREQHGGGAERSGICRVCLLSMLARAASKVRREFKPKPKRAK